MTTSPKGDENILGLNDSSDVKAVCPPSLRVVSMQKCPAAVLAGPSFDVTGSPCGDGELAKPWTSDASSVSPEFSRQDATSFSVESRDCDEGCAPSAEPAGRVEWTRDVLRERLRFEPPDQWIFERVNRDIVRALLGHGCLLDPTIKTLDSEVRRASVETDVPSSVLLACILYVKRGLVSESWPGGYGPKIRKLFSTCQKILRDRSSSLGERPREAAKFILRRAYPSNPVFRRAYEVSLGTLWSEIGVAIVKLPKGVIFCDAGNACLRELQTLSSNITSQKGRRESALAKALESHVGDLDEYDTFRDALLGEKEERENMSYARLRAVALKMRNAKFSKNLRNSKFSRLQLRRDEAARVRRMKRGSPTGWDDLAQAVFEALRPHATTCGVTAYKLRSVNVANGNIENRKHYSLSRHAAYPDLFAARAQEAFRQFTDEDTCAVLFVVYRNGTRHTIRLIHTDFGSPALSGSSSDALNGWHGSFGDTDGHWALFVCVIAALYASVIQLPAAAFFTRRVLRSIRKVFFAMRVFVACAFVFKSQLNGSHGEATNEDDLEYSTTIALCFLALGYVGGDWLVRLVTGSLLALSLPFVVPVGLCKSVATRFMTCLLIAFSVVDIALVPFIYVLPRHVRQASVVAFVAALSCHTGVHTAILAYSLYNVAEFCETLLSNAAATYLLGLDCVRTIIENVETEAHDSNNPNKFLALWCACLLRRVEENRLRVQRFATLAASLVFISCHCLFVTYWFVMWVYERGINGLNGSFTGKDDVKGKKDQDKKRQPKREENANALPGAVVDAARGAIDAVEQLRKDNNESKDSVNPKPDGPEVVQAMPSVQSLGSQPDRGTKDPVDVTFTYFTRFNEPMHVLPDGSACALSRHATAAGVLGDLLKTEFRDNVTPSFTNLLSKVFPGIAANPLSPSFTEAVCDLTDMIVQSMGDRVRHEHDSRLARQIKNIVHYGYVQNDVTIVSEDAKAAGVAAVDLRHPNQRRDKLLTPQHLVRIKVVRRTLHPLRYGVMAAISKAFDTRLEVDRFEYLCEMNRVSDVVSSTLPHSIATGDISNFVKMAQLKLLSLPNYVNESVADSMVEHNNVLVEALLCRSASKMPIMWENVSPSVKRTI